MKLIILDRDGVINEDSDAYIKSVDEYIPIPGSLEAIARLNRAGYTVVVATNQSGIARGLFDENTLQQMHEKLKRLLAEVGGTIANIYYCPHGPDEACDCRKPMPGMLQQILKDYPVDPTSVPAIGDSLRDLQAAQQVGAQPILVKTGKGQKTVQQLSDQPELQQVPAYQNLAAAVDALLKQD
jgi:D-glycero-D-manno-heptose 1,7-bisphosphate phosphatase